MQRTDWTKSFIVNLIELFGAGLIYYLVFGVIFSDGTSSNVLSVILAWPIVYLIVAAVAGLFWYLFRGGIPIIFLPVWLAIVVASYFLLVLKLAGRPLSWLLVKTFRQQFGALITIEPLGFYWFAIIPEIGDAQSWRWAG